MKGEKMTEQVEKICSLDGGTGYDLREPGGHLENVGLNVIQAVQPLGASLVNVFHAYVGLSLATLILGAVAACDANSSGKLTEQKAIELIKAAYLSGERRTFNLSNFSETSPLGKVIVRMINAGDLRCERVLGTRIIGAFWVSDKFKNVVKNCRWSFGLIDHFSLYTHQLEFSRIVDMLSVEQEGYAIVIFEYTFKELEHLGEFRKVDSVAKDIDVWNGKTCKKRATLRKFDQGWRPRGIANLACN